MSLLTRILNSLAPDKPNVPAGIEQPDKYASGESLYFPEILGASADRNRRYPHFMKFSIHEFTAADANLTEDASLSEILGSVKKNRSINETATKQIFLHIPDNLTQTLSHDWSTESITAAVARYGLIGAGIESLITMIKEGGIDLESAAGLAEVAGTIAETIGGAGKGTKEILTAFASNRTVNPRYEAIFTGTKLREFTFDFKLTPKNQKEATQILNIIKAFRYFSAPARADDRYLIPPSVFRVEFYFATNGTLNNALFKIDNCVLQGVDVNYATTGQFATFNDGMPVEIAMQLRFVEIQALTRDKIEMGY